jgi:hypothetical protein
MSDQLLALRETLERTRKEEKLATLMEHAKTCCVCRAQLILVEAGKAYQDAKNAKSTK